MKTSKDAGRAYANQASACAGQDLRGCLAQAGMLASGQGVAPDASSALGLRDRGLKGLEQACNDKKDAEACEAIGDYYLGQYDSTAKKDPVKALTAYNSACAAGNDVSCVEAAKMMEKGESPIPKNPGAAKQYYELACTRGSVAEACTKVGKKPPSQRTSAQPQPQPKTNSKPSGGTGVPRRGR